MVPVPTLWSGPTVEHSPSLRFLAAGPRAELSPDDARAAGVASGDEVKLTADGESVAATAAVRTGVPAGSVFLSGAEPPAGEVEVGA